MTDRYDQDMILGYVEGDLGDEQRAAFEAMLADDHELRQLVLQMRLDREALRSLAGFSAPVGLVDQVMQAQERDALLGDPAAPEPLPMVVPVSRRKVRRLLAYSGVAAVLLLSFSVVFMTLRTPNLLNKPPSMAQSGSLIDPLADTEAGLAMIDEDAVYDNLDEIALESPQATPGKAEEAPPVLAMKDDPAGRNGDTAGIMGRLDVADAAGKPLPEAEAVSSLASSAEADKSGDALSAVVGMDTASAVGFTGPTRSSLPAGAANTKEREPYAGYALPSLPQNVQLEVASTSPIQARRDIRHWAMENSVRVVEEPSRTARKTVAVARRSGAFGSDFQVRGLASTPPVSSAPRVSPASADDKPAEYQLVLFVEENQVPSLLAYLNRGHRQRADVVPIVADRLEDKKEAAREARLAKKVNELDEALDATGVEESAPDDAPAPTVALSNRLVDIGSAWHLDTALRERSLASKSLQPSETTDTPQASETPDPPDTLDPPDTADSSESSDTSGSIKPGDPLDADLTAAHEPETKRDPRAMRLQDLFGLGKRPSPATRPATESSSEPKTPNQRRLQVIIRQVAEDELRNAPGAAAPEPDTTGAPTHDDGGDTSP